ncbi:DUF2971 domain-containing protein [Flavobacterium sp. WLB]|uniref:DUF2971 domain-containing protein n=1 Tax=unclassified Flavobacterium TaxID=196869 RepID=UPI0006AB7FE0|nr:MULTISPECIES: DUF2971 domain-containing protein [unclassified Flavobacterium]KOP36887.1 hypothetical protein AKO67_18335 [Flavobacterium sp. VMW]OWU89030.1 hypothetical protein APR43_19835 [Flavobacterium sp. NLM]PUU69926.1 DUF2971 domain-containing protein [Flavobacterium sp. WLB]
MKPENYPDIIYKYRNWAEEYHKNILLKGEVYLSAPKNFNDPFDFRIPKNFMLLDSQEKIERYVDEGLEKHKEWLIKDGRNIKDERVFQLKRLENLELYQQEHERIESEATDKHYGILSLSSRWDSILMWSHYGYFHKGFNVGYNEEKMRQSGFFGKGGPVAYSDNFPAIDPFSEHNMITSFMQTHFKSKEWEYEQEYRLTKLFYPNVPTEKDRTIVIPLDFIEEINLGISISEKDKNEIVDFAKNKNIKIFQTEKIPFKFGLTRFQI